MSRKKQIWIAALALPILFFQAIAADSQDDPAGAAQTLLKSANRDRAAHALAPLQWSPALASAAQQHAARMARENTLSHQFPDEPGLAQRAAQSGAHFSSVAENVAEGPSAESIHRQWMSSPPHRANLLDPHLDSVGIAVENRGGALFAVEDFSLRVAKLSLQEQELLVASQLRKRGLHMLDVGSDSRRSCALDNGYAGNHTPSFVLHYTTAELETLPDMLQQRIQSGKYHSAAVGACPGAGNSAFSDYRVAVLLYE
jgi:hypothetical protein